MPGIKRQIKQNCYIHIYLNFLGFLGQKFKIVKQSYKALLSIYIIISFDYLINVNYYNQD